MNNEKGIRVTGILLAGGTGSRFGAAGNKVYELLGGIPVLQRSLRVMEQCSRIEEILLVCRGGEEEEAKALIGSARVRLIHGGDSRRESVHHALCEAHGEKAVIHDGARPFLREEDILRGLDALETETAATMAVRAKDTIKTADADGYVTSTVPRKDAWLIHTPQFFSTAALREAHAFYSGTQEATDDCMLMEAAGHRVLLIEGSPDNMKITAPGDLRLAEAILRGR